MSDAKAAEPAAAEADTGPKPSKIPLILGALNTLVILGAVGMLSYTKLVYKRPQITEDAERDRLAAEKASPKPTINTGYVAFEPVTINISPSPPNLKPADGTAGQIQGKLHYATIGFSLELNNIGRKDEVEALRPMIADQFLALVGRKQFHELTSVQGRYVLKTQLIEIVNGLSAKRLPAGAEDPGPLVNNLFFIQFIVQ
jgi:flagellar basal body-associated protein FliL